MKFVRRRIGIEVYAVCLCAPLLLTGTVARLGAQAMQPPRLASRLLAAKRFTPSSTAGRVTETDRGRSTLKGAGLGLVIGALAGVAVGAMIESGNKGGAPEVRERYKGFGYAVCIPVGAVVGAVIGGIEGATRD